MDDEQGIYRVEVLAIMGRLPTCTSMSTRSFVTSKERTTMKRKRKIFRTPEERKAWEARSEARIRDLQSHIDRITAELAAKKRPPAAG
jgi:hypothetical protein